MVHVTCQNCLASQNQCNRIAMTLCKHAWDSAIPRPEMRECDTDVDQRRTKGSDVAVCSWSSGRSVESTKWETFGPFRATLLPDLHILHHITSSSQDLNFYYPCHPCPVQSQKHAELSCLSQERPQGFRLPHQCARRRGTGPSPLKAKSRIIQLLNIDGILLKGTQQKELESSIRAFVPKSWLSTILTSAITGPMLLPWQQMMWRNRTVKTSSIEVPEYQECIEMLPCIIGVSMNFCQWNRSAHVFFYFSS